MSSVSFPALSAGFRDMLDVAIPLGAWPLLAWHLTPGEKVSQAIMEATAAFTQATGHPAQYAFIGVIPTGAAEFVEVGLVTLVQADWVPAGFVALASGGMQQIEPEFRNWKRTSEVQNG